MKKLMIAAVVACATLAGFSSDVKWTATNVYKDGTTDKITGTAAYFFATADTSNTYKDNLVVLATIEAAIADGTWDGTGALGGAYTMAGGFSEGAVVGAIPGTTEAPNTLSGFLVFLDAATYADATKYMITGVVTSPEVTSLSGSKLITFGSQAANTWNDINSSPEPTSAMLLLLGVAGLALKRKRA